MALSDPHHEERPWGSFTLFTHNSPSTVKILTIKAGEAISLQTHEQREEFWYVLSGTGTVEIDGEVKNAKPQDTFNVKRGAEHRITAESDISILEIATGDFDENDIVRIEDKYERIIHSEDTAYD